MGTGETEVVDEEVFAVGVMVVEVVSTVVKENVMAVEGLRITVAVEESVNVVKVAADVKGVLVSVEVEVAAVVKVY